MQTTSVRIDRATHQELKRLASELEVTVGEAVRIAVRRATQERIGAQLATELKPDESAWLDADLR
jgi:antitoxin component of RelBE/YafQ-DinJ toxin-antitoxin module